MILGFDFSGTKLCLHAQPNCHVENVFHHRKKGIRAVQTSANVVVFFVVSEIVKTPYSAQACPVCRIIQFYNKSGC